MTSVFFTFAERSTDQEREALLRQLRSAQGVSDSSALVPGSSHPDVARIAVVDVRDDLTADVLARLRDDPLVESAGEQPQRGLT